MRLLERQQRDDREAEQGDEGEVGDEGTGDVLHIPQRVDDLRKRVLEAHRQHAADGEHKDGGVDDAAHPICSAYVASVPGSVLGRYREKFKPAAEGRF